MATNKDDPGILGRLLLKMIKRANGVKSAASPSSTPPGIPVFQKRTTVKDKPRGSFVFNFRNYLNPKK